LDVVVVVVVVVAVVVVVVVVVVDDHHDDVCVNDGDEIDEQKFKEVPGIAELHGVALPSKIQ